VSLPALPWTADGPLGLNASMLNVLAPVVPLRIIDCMLV
jgi:hypothetical protein